MEISIIIPVYNVASYLEQCLSSCINQTFRDIEIIVVNDGSTDSSLQVIEEYAARDSRIVVINKVQNEGLIYARKSGIERARGNYLFHLDGDDFIPPGAMESLYKNIKEQDADMAIGDLCKICNGRSVGGVYFYMDPAVSGHDFLYELICQSTWNLCGKLMRKSLCNDLLYYDVFMGEDLYLTMQIAPRVKKVTFVHEYVYIQNIRENSITNDKKGGKRYVLYLEFINAFYFLLNHFPYEKRIEEEVSAYIIMWLYRCQVRKEKLVRDAFWREFKKAGSRKIVREWYGMRVYLKIYLYFLVGLRR